MKRFESKLVRYLVVDGQRVRVVRDLGRGLSGRWTW
jgi:hypothetical protein